MHRINYYALCVLVPSFLTNYSRYHLFLIPPGKSCLYVIITHCSSSIASTYTFSRLMQQDYSVLPEPLRPRLWPNVRILWSLFSFTIYLSYHYTHTIMIYFLFITELVRRLYNSAETTHNLNICFRKNRKYVQETRLYWQPTLCFRNTWHSWSRRI